MLIVRVVGEHVPSGRRRWRRCRLDVEVGSGEDRVRFPIRVWDLLHLHLVEHDADADSCSPLDVIYEDELAPLGLGQVSEQCNVTVILVVLGHGNGVGVVRWGMAHVVHIVDRRHRSDAYGSALRIGRIEVLCLADIGRRVNWLSIRCLVVVCIGPVGACWTKQD